MPDQQQEPHQGLLPGLQRLQGLPGDPELPDSDNEDFVDELLPEPPVGHLRDQQQGLCDQEPNNEALHVDEEARRDLHELPAVDQHEAPDVDEQVLVHLRELPDVDQQLHDPHQHQRQPLGKLSTVFLKINIFLI